MEVGGTAWLQATCDGMEGQQLQFVLEQRVDGNWIEIGSGDGTVGQAGKDKAHAGLHLPKGVPGVVKLGWKFDEKMAADMLARCQEMAYQTVTFILDKKTKDGWEECKVFPDVQVDGDVAQVNTYFPVLAKAAISPKTPKAGEEVELIGYAAGMDGLQAQIILEEQTDKGWTEAATFNTQFDGTTARATFQLPAGPPTLLSTSWKLAGPGVELTAEATGLEGADLLFALEVEQPDGSWAPVGEQSATVSKTFAKASFDLGITSDTDGSGDAGDADSQTDATATDSGADASSPAESSSSDTDASGSADFGH